MPARKSAWQISPAEVIPSASLWEITRMVSQRKIDLAMASAALSSRFM
jgi:PIN domain nuclease of toxin-antitoxin system